MNTDIYNKMQYKTFDQEEATSKARKILEKIKRNKLKLTTYRLDSDTIIQIREGKNADKIIEKLKSKQRKISLIEQIEYGHYA